MKRAVLIGAGSIARQHVSAVRACADRVQLVAAHDLDRARADAFCAEHAIPRAHDTVEELLRAERPDLVLICTPPASHTTLSVQSLDAGAWVLCEKPLCGSLAELDQIETAEQRSDAFCSSVVQNRFGSGAKHVKRLIEDGTLGRPMVGLCQTTWYRTEAYYAVPWHGRWASAFGGPTMQLGIHTMDLFLWLWPDWEEVTAHAATLNHQMEVEDVSLALVRFGSGALASVINSAVSPAQETVLRLDFERATVEAKYLYRHNNADWRLTAPPNSAWEEEATQWATIPEDVPASHAAQLASLLDSMERGERPLVSGPEARRTIEFTTCLYKSSASGAAVRRGSIGPQDPYYRSVSGHAT